MDYNLYQQPKQTAPKGKAIASMSCGIASICTCAAYGFVGIALAIVALVLQKNFRKENGGEHNAFSKTGAITGTVGLILSIVSFIFWVVILVLIGLKVVEVPPYQM